MSNNREFQTYQNFFSQEEAHPMVGFLEENSIPYTLEHNREIIDSTIVGTGVQPEWALRIPAKYFSKVNELLDQHIAQIKEVPTSHYLQKFDNKELQEVVENADEWTKQDVHFAKLLLTQRDGEDILKEAETAAVQKQQVLREGKKGSALWMYTYFGVSIFGSVLFSPLFFMIGLAMGWYYWRDQTVDSTGERFYTFDLGTRNFGRVIFFTGIALLCVSFLLAIFAGISIFGALIYLFV